MLLTLLKKISKKKAKKTSAFLQIIDWISTGFCLMNAFFYILIFLGIIVVIIAITQSLMSIAEALGFI